MDRIQQLGDKFGAIGIFVIRKDDQSVLYFNQAIQRVRPDIKVGMRCSDCFSGACENCPISSVDKKEAQLVISYVEQWNGFVEMTADEYMWEDTVPAYLITVIPQMQGEDLKMSVRYNKMMERAAVTLTESLAYGNFTKNTYTKYVRENSQKQICQSKVEPLEVSYQRFLGEIHPQEQEAFARDFSVESLHRRLQNGEKEIYGEFRKGKNGVYHWISFRCSPLANPFDEDELCVFIVRDINIRKQMEQQLAIQLNATYQSIPGGVVILKLDDRLTIVNASGSFYDMMGKTKKDYEGGYLGHILQEDRQLVQKRINMVRVEGKPFDIVYREMDSAGGTYWVQARGVKISEEDNVPIYLTIRMDVTELKNAQQQLIEEQEQYREYTEGIIDTLSNLVEFRDLDSGQHIKRTKALTRILLLNLKKRHPDMELSDESIEKISEAAALHDVGKIAISDTILNKPGRLTQEEFEEMKKHTVKGYEILKTLNLSQDEEQMKYSLDISRHHHERWDGGGYPDHLKGDEIPLWSQVVSIVDVYDALVSPRVYKQAYSHEKALQMILDGECGCFNPELLECLKESVELLEREYGRTA